MTPQRFHGRKANTEPRRSRGERCDDIAEIVRAEVDARYPGHNHKKARPEEDMQSPAPRRQPGRKIRGQHAIEQSGSRDVAAWEAVGGQGEERIVQAWAVTTKDLLQQQVQQHAAGQHDGEREKPIPASSPQQVKPEQESQDADGGDAICVGDDQHPSSEPGSRARMKPVRDLSIHFDQWIARDNVFCNASKQPGRADEQQRAQCKAQTGTAVRVQAGPNK